MKKSSIEWERCFRVAPRRSYDNLLGISYSLDNLLDILSEKFIEIGTMESRFAVDGIFVFYFADSIETAVKEASYSFSKTFKDSDEEPKNRYYMVMDVSIDKDMEFCDIRGLKVERPELYNPDDYSKSKEFAKELYDKGENGVLYDSVRYDKGECVALYIRKDTNIMEDIKINVLGYVIFHWNGQSVEVIDGTDK